MLSLALAFMKMGKEDSSEWLSLPCVGCQLPETILLALLLTFICARN